MIWIFLVLMTAAAVFAALWPLLRKPGATVAVEGNDLAVYRDQLEEIERDRATGLIGAVEAEAARIEVSRRLIGAAEAAALSPSPADRKRRPGKRAGAAVEAKGSRRDAQPRRRRLVAAITLMAFPLGAAGLYLVLGSPDFAGQPLAARIAAPAAGNEAVEAAFARVEAHLQQDPEDGRGWEVIAPVYMRLGRYEDAVRARSNALRLLGANAQREADLGEALVAAANGIVTAEAKAVFDEAIQHDPTDVSARYYQGLAAEQDGNPAEAARLWRGLLADAPQGAPWTVSVRRALARVDPAAAGETPSVKETAQAAQPAGEQNQMIRSMVERLAARLHEDGSDVDGWLRLVRSYNVLGDAGRGQAAATDARAALANDADKLRRFDEGLKTLAAEPTAATGKTPPGASEAIASTNAAPSHDPMSMVERLAARLQKDGSDVDGWLMLLRSYKTLGKTDRARAAAADAHRALAGDPDKLRRLDEGVKSLGVEASGQ